MQIPDFESIYTDYFADVYKYILSICRNETVAEEITQETFSKQCVISTSLTVRVNCMYGYVRLLRIPISTIAKRKNGFLLN